MTPSSASPIIGRMRRDAVPSVATLLAAAWLGAELMGSPWLAAGVAALTLAGTGTVALSRRPRRTRGVLGVGLTLVGVFLFAVLAAALAHPDTPLGLPMMLLAAVLLLLPVPILYALTFPGDSQ